MHSKDEEHVLGFRPLGLVLAALLLLTGVTVWVTGFDFGFLNVLVAMSVASTKAALVVFFFMHLKYEGRALQLMVLTVFIILAIFIGFTFFDVAYR
ncbi:MAG: cytochrome C oxidase subunit IV family protein [Desulfovibrio sp.]|jgi:cytochrome c oxidase subunit 4|nr:cytochrome C oxidase subunit IV family protein [Desulfovibrio sp.]